MVTTFNCSENAWLKKLYDLREKWCPAFSKDYFSAGILSSQGSESTNNSLSRKLNATSPLCDFYHFFVKLLVNGGVMRDQINNVVGMASPRYQSHMLVYYIKLLEFTQLMLTSFLRRSLFVLCL
ncbi:unnamed protein product [Cuscuta europaea]|uniref:Protein FAR1-RELATED SEQUENCE n=1 Tax=Cuscuta europaea TaxID=41803 RepID=A0A9P0Z5U4_CUSEU|nr:unnamed protein product [Cuscuta europaea]